MLRTRKGFALPASAAAHTIQACRPAVAVPPAYQHNTTADAGAQSAPVLGTVPPNAPGGASTSNTINRPQGAAQTPQMQDGTSCPSGLRPAHKVPPNSRRSGRKVLQRHAGSSNPTPPGTSHHLNSRTASLHAASGIKQPALRSSKKSNGIGAPSLLNAPKAVFKGFAGRRHFSRLKIFFSIHIITYHKNNIIT